MSDYISKMAWECHPILTLKSKNRKYLTQWDAHISQDNNAPLAAETLHCFLLNNNKTVSALAWHNKLLQITVLVTLKRLGVTYRA